MLTRALAVSLSLFLFVATSELIVRVGDFKPRAQRVDLRPGNVAKLRPYMRDGSVLWAAAETDARENAGCVGAVDVLLIGSSISYGIDLPAAASLAGQLQARFDERLPGLVCVHGHAQPGYVGENKLAEARRALSLLNRRPAVMVWGLWQNEPDRWTVVDDEAWIFSDVVTDASGLPAVPGVPAAANRALWSRSALWRYATVATARSRSFGEGVTQMAAFAGERLPELDRLVGSDVTPLFWVALPLAGTWRDGRAHDDEAWQPFVAGAKARGWTVLWEDELLADTTPAEVRLDPCCHLNATGSAAMAEALYPHIVAALPRSEPAL
jgi:hypothetical protein